MSLPDRGRVLSLAGVGKHVPALDGLRGVAVILVITMHYVMYLGYIGPVHPAVTAVTGVGWSGVDLFFVLSGYLITGILLDSRLNSRYFRTFYARRVLRIFPLYYGFLAVVFLVVPSIFEIQSARFGELREEQWWYWSYLSNVLNAMRGGWGPDGFVTTHFWSLAVEEQFYLFWPVVVYLLPGRPLIRSCLWVIATLPLLRLGLRLVDVNVVAVYVLTVTRMDALAMGALIAALVRTEAGLEFVQRWYRPIGTIALLSMAGLFAWRRTPGQFDIVTGTLGHSVVAVLFGALLVSALAARRGTLSDSILSHPLARFFGRYSYGMYVYHLPLVGLLATTFPLVDLTSAVRSPALAGIAFILTALVGTVVLSFVSWHLYEKQFLRLKAFVPYERR